MKILTLGLFLLALALPALATEQPLKLVVTGANNLTTVTNFAVRVGEVLHINSILTTDDLLSKYVLLQVRYEGLPTSLAIRGAASISGPCEVQFRITSVNTHNEIAVAECVWVYNSGGSKILQPVNFERSTDLVHWHTVQSFQDPSTNAFYRWNIEPPLIVTPEGP
jgi:hypothetical protein